MRASIVAATLLLWTHPVAAALRGTAVTPEGAPVPQATVKLFAMLPQHEREAKLLAGEPIEPLAAAKAGAKGDFTLDVPREGNFIAEVAAPGHAPVAFRTTGAEDVGGIALRPAPSKNGRVTANGAPVANAMLLFTSADGGTLAVRSDEEGKYAIPDPAAWLPSVTAVHPSYARLVVHPDDRKPLPLDLKLSAGTTIKGRVLAPDGKSGTKAKLAVDGIPYGESGDDGAFELPRVPADWRELTATAGSLAARAGRGAHQTLRLAPALSLSGSVVDAKTRVPLAGALVLLSSNDLRDDTLAEVVTDEKGRFTIAPVLPGQYGLVASSAGYVTWMGPQSITPGGAPKALYLRRDIRVSGRVTDDERTPVAGARVAFTRPGVSFGPVEALRVSAPDGRYAIRIASADPGDVELTATRRGYATAIVRGQKLTAGDDKTVHFELTRGIAVSGVVTGPNGEPLRDAAVASVEVSDPRFNTSAPDMRDAPRTDAEGKFELRLRAAIYNLHLSADGFAPKLVRQVKVEPGLEPLRIALERAVAISGRVVYAGGEPAPNLQVHAYLDGSFVQTRSDDGGGFVLTGLPPRSVNVQVSSDDGAIEEERQIKAPADGVLIELTPSVRVSGRVLAAANKRAVTDFRLELRPPQGGTVYYGGLSVTRDVHDSEGKFVLERVFVRPSELVVSAPGFTPATVALALEKGKDLTDLEVTLAPGSRVSGRVTTAGGAPADQVRVLWEGSGRPGWTSLDQVLSDANGDYAIDGIPYGEATLSFTKRGMQSARKTLTIDGPETRLDVQLEPGKPLPGRVVTDEGAPVAGASITASSTSGDANWQRTTSDDAGRFTLEGLAPGIYRIAAAKPGFVTANLPSVDISTASELNLTLSTGATITGRILGIPPEQYTSVMVVAGGEQPQTQSSAMADASGNYRMEGAPVGKVRVRAMIRGEKARASEFHDLETQARGMYKVDIEFLEHNTLRGRVTRRGAPVSGGTIAFLPKTPPRTSASSAIGEDGQYEVSGVRSGETSVIVMSFSENYRYMTTATITRSATLDVDVNPATLTGAVVDEATDQPIAGAEIVLEPADPTADSWLRNSGRSGADGRFVVSNVVPGAYRLRVSREGYAAIASDRSFAEGGTAEVTLRLSPTAGVTLRVTDTRTGQAVQSFVTAFAPDGSIVWQGNLSMKADGVARVPLPPGRYRTSVSSAGLGTVYVTLTSPGSQEVALRPGGRLFFDNSSATALRAILLAADGSVYDADPWTSTAEFFVGPGSSTALRDLAAGQYTVQLLDERGVVTKSVPVTIVEGEATRVGL